MFYFNIFVLDSTEREKEDKKSSILCFKSTSSELWESAAWSGGLFWAAAWLHSAANQCWNIC